MKKILLFLAVSLCMSTLSMAQTVVKGKVADPADNRNLENAVVSLLQTKDSTLAKFTRIKKDGSFEIPQVAQGKYYILITHPYFADYFETLQVTDQPLDVGSITLLSKMKMLEEVVVKSGSPIRMKGDTTIFTADSFKVREGANVEELLKRLPGIQVDKDGKITAMGEQVKKVLVDGEEFFGSDPGIATKNLQASNIQEVQVYDKKSDQATFTGIDDGSKEKTINLKLKDNAKKGYFGKAEAGGGTDSRFSNSVLANSFKAKRKLAGYGIMSNTGKLNLDWDDNEKYGGGGNMEMMDGGGIMITNDGDNYNYSTGMPTNWNAGLNYSNKFNKDKNNLNLSYKLIKMNVPDWSTSNSRTYLADSIWNTNNRNNSYGTTFKQNANFMFESMLDSSNTIKITAKGYMNDSKNQSNFYSESLTPGNNFINKNSRISDNESQRNNLNTNVLWMHKFKKPFRTLAVNGNMNLVNSSSEGTLQSETVFYNNGDSTGNYSFDQKTIAKTTSQTYTAKATYTEPLMKDTYMELSYAANLINSKVDRDVSDIGNGFYDDPVDSLSNSYDFKQFGHRPGINFKLNKKKYNITIGGEIGFFNYEQLNKTTGLERNYTFTNYFPRASFNYKFKPSQSLNLSYSGSTNAPNIDQLQPILVNTDPLNIYTGNPNLDPSFRHNLNLNFNSYNMMKQQYVGLYAGGGFTQNAFVNSSTYRDSIRYYQTVNTNGVANLYAGLWAGGKIKELNIDLGLQPRFNYNRGVDFLAVQNGAAAKNISNYYTFETNLSVTKRVDSVYSITIAPKIEYTKSTATINKAASAEYFRYGVNVSGEYEFPKKIFLRTDVDMTRQKKDDRFIGNFNSIVWDMHLSKQIAKNKFEIKMSVYDILNQKIRYDRNISGNSIYESNGLILKRFGMLSFLWNFNNNGVKSK